MSDASILRTVFGFDRLRAAQQPVIDAVRAGRDVLAIMPTGGGKSLCYQLPALEREGLTVVISPLIALMRDQVRALRELGVAAGALTSGNTEEETEAVFSQLESGTLRLLYMAPERLGSGGAIHLLRKTGVASLAIDEAHCVSQWGHDFRPDYLRIGELIKALPDVQVTAFTATADAQTRDDIIRRLFDAPPEIFIQGFDRPNLRLAFAVKKEPRKQLLDFVTVRRRQSGIVYCGTRNKTEVLAKALNEAGLKALHYHAGMEAEARREAEIRFQQEDGLVVCATVAFGMGIDKPDIRFVVHADLPKSVEAYYQEIGRAGRDGDPAETLVLYGPDDIRLRRSQIDDGLAENDRKGADHGRLNALLGLAEAQGCRRQLLLRYFGEDSAPCGNCDLCSSPPETFDATEAVRMALSAVLRTEQMFGTGHLIDVLLGNETEKTRRWKHGALPTFGVGKNWDRGQWGSIFRQILGLDLVRPDPSRKGALQMTELARPILRGEKEVMLRVDTIEARAARRRSEPLALVAEEDEALLSALKSKRRALAEAARVPAYVIFADKTLNEMATRKPASLDDMMGITGVGAKKLDKYGATFLAVINEDVDIPHPARNRLSGRSEGAVFDQLQEAQNRLARGENGLDIYMSCSSSTLAKIARYRPASMEDLASIGGVGASKAERFGAAFMDVLHGADDAIVDEAH